MKKLKTRSVKTKKNHNHKTEYVQNIFSNITNKYDLMNDLMSLGSHRLWKKRLLEIMNVQPYEHIIDVGTGTNDIASLINKKHSNVLITAIDLNLEMLAEGRQKNNKLKNISWVNCNAEELPFKNNSFDKYVISFCIRNVTFIEKALRESLRVLKPGGCFYCLEFSTPNSSVTKKFYNFYKSKIIPLMGQVIANNKDAYKYLDKSISDFPQQEIFTSKLNEIGYENVSVIDMFNGIVSIHQGYKVI